MIINEAVLRKQVEAGEVTRDQLAELSQWQDDYLDLCERMMIMAGALIAYADSLIPPDDAPEVEKVIRKQEVLEVHDRILLAAQAGLDYRSRRPIPLVDLAAESRTAAS